jgi:hypothetical protein
MILTEEWVESDGTCIKVYEKAEELYCDFILRKELSFGRGQEFGSDNPALALVKLRYRLVSGRGRLLSISGFASGVISCPNLTDDEGCCLLKKGFPCPLKFEHSLDHHLEMARFKKQLYKQGVLA